MSLVLVSELCRKHKKTHKHTYIQPSHDHFLFLGLGFTILFVWKKVCRKLFFRSGGFGVKTFVQITIIIIIFFFFFFFFFLGVAAGLWMAITVVALAGLWRKPTFSDAVLSPAHKVRHTHSFIARGGVKDRAASSASAAAWQKQRRARRRVSQKRLQKRTDAEFDLVIVPADGISMSGSDSEDSDWSVGWFEPHHTDFTDNELEDSFAVLVPCYGSPARPSVAAAGSSEEPKTEPAWATILANLARQTDEGGSFLTS